MPFFMKYLLLCLCSICLITSCKQANRFETATSDTLSYSFKTYEKHSKNCLRPDSVCATVKFDHPVFEQVALNQAVENEMMAIFHDEADSTKSKPHSFDDIANPFVDEYDKVIAEGKQFTEEINEKNPGGFFAMPWYMEGNMKVFRQTDTYIMLHTNTNWFMGGPHPISMEYYYVFDRQSFKRVLLEDLFIKGYERKLLEIAEKKFRENEKLKPADKLDDLNGYFFENEKFILNDNFVLTEKGIKFLYNVYEIKAYAAGITELELSYESLKGILK